MIDLPTEEIIIAGPGVNLGLAHFTFETAGMSVRMLLPGRGIGQPAIGTVEIFRRPNVVSCHGAIMRRCEHEFQRNCSPPSMAGYFDLQKPAKYWIAVS